MFGQGFESPQLHFKVHIDVDFFLLLIIDLKKVAGINLLSLFLFRNFMGDTYKFRETFIV